MILGLDIDGCLNDSEYFNNFTLREFEREMKIQLQPNFLLLHHFGLSDDLYQKYMNMYFPLMVKNNQPRPYTREFLYELRLRGHEIKIITARDAIRDKKDEPYKGYMMKRDTLEWFDKNGIPYDKIIFSATKDGYNKGWVCQHEHVDVMLEDEEKNIESIVDVGIPCIIMKNLKNQNLNYPNTYFVENMSGYFHQICSMEKL